MTEECARLVTKDAEFKKDVSRFAEFGIYDMRYPTSIDKAKIIADKFDFAQVLEVIYVIRCNFFHEKKSMNEPHDLEVVLLSYRIMSKLFAPIVEKIDVS